MPFPWENAGSAPYNNISGINPRLTDPANGDYRPMPDSPAIGYGCQTFRRSTHAENAGPLIDCTHTFEIQRRDVIDVSGVITANTTWNANKVRVVGDVTVDPGVVLAIAPGTIVEFQDFYTLRVGGTLLAVGSPDHEIRFTTDEPEAFTIDYSLAGCWNGLRFEDTSATNQPSRLSHCIIEFSKAVEGGAGRYWYGGGAVSVVNFTELTIDNCTIRNNVAEYGGAIFLYRQACPTIAGNLIVANHALTNGSAIYCAYSYPRFINNTIVGNPIHNLNNPYVDSCGVQHFLSKSILSNNIVRNNNPDYIHLPTQILGGKTYYINHNNIEDGAVSESNIDVNPRFADTLGVDGVSGTSDDNFRLLPYSPCVDAGMNDVVPSQLAEDLDGEPRFVDGDYDGYVRVDLGAFETGNFDCDGDGFVNLTDFGLFASCMIGPTGDAPLHCACFDIDRDGDADLFDLAGFQFALDGP